MEEYPTNSRRPQHKIDRRVTEEVEDEEVKIVRRSAFSISRPLVAAKAALVNSWVDAQFTVKYDRLERIKYQHCNCSTEH